MTDIIERLLDEPKPHEWKTGLGPVSMEVWHNTCLEAADEIERLSAENAKLRKTLIMIRGSRLSKLDAFEWMMRDIDRALATDSTRRDD